MEAPRFEISRGKVLEKFDEVRKVSDFVSYSSKTNPLITQILEKERGCFFSIHSPTELKNVRDKKRVVYLAQGWDEEEISFLLKEGIKNFVVDNEEDLRILEDFMKNRREKINLYLRLKLKERTLKTEKYFVFGMSSRYVRENVRRLKELRWVGEIGIHFHRKTQNISEWNFKEELEDSFDESFFRSLDNLIIGGGLPSVYANTNIKVFEGIFNKISEFKEWVNGLGVKMGIEPGRYIAAPSGKLVCYVKNVYDNNVVLNVSVYNSDMDALIVPVKLLVESEVSKEEGHPFVLKGITPCSMDLFRYRVYLIEVPKKGDKIVFLNAGAYNFTTDFCDLEKPSSVIVD